MNRFSMTMQTCSSRAAYGSRVQRSIALIGLALVGTSGVYAYSPKDDWQTQTVPVKTDRDDGLWKSSQTEGGVYTVRPGDTIEEIAQTFQVSQTELIAHNNLADPNFILVGQELTIPATKPELPSFLPTISQEIAQGKKSELVTLAAMFGILPVGGDSPVIPLAVTDQQPEPSPPVMEQKVAALPTEPQLPVVGEQQPVVVAPAVTEQKVAALPTEPQLPVVAEQKPVESVLNPPDKVAVVSDQSGITPPQRIAALTTIEIVRRSPTDSLDAAPAVKSPELPPLPKTSPTTQSDVTATSKSSLRPLEVPATKVEVKNIYQEVEKLRQELYSNQPQKVAALNPDSRAGVRVDPIDFGQPELPSLSAAHFLPVPEELPSLDEYDFVWPASGIITSGFGWRWGRLHQGIDIAAPIGTPIWAAGSGVVQFAGWNNGGYGYMIDILHSNGTVTRYAHLNAIYVKVGQRVQQGQVIAEMGSTGYSTGPHLHFEIRPNGGVAVNPMTYLARVPRDRRTAQSRPFATTAQR
ncbi:MAG: peptidoglycan DD-metalloendopeptidase family protein [Pseudanabaenaceae cyanobacterium SKYGB_i_bin29]|nr:peptidoglycan DD-metalloendopeptidase family protein [Pseudanabaenaceae cyanobacterium SKYG29]MDW8420782.1 peptidoglycan DD-metalloendopeptidase family protein [Pseudanabaenaceae cyanobacterium SKYGB_i_bin29]